LVLQSEYCEQVRGQLASAEEKKSKKRRQRLLGDGLPRLLTDDEFFTRVQEHEAHLRAEADKKESRKRGKDAWVKALAEWKLLDKERKRRNDLKLVAWKTQVERWEEERDLAKAEKRRPSWTKPKRPTKELEP
ncbi:uncharacterized protein B0H18DRAFT_850839, partial [Fomitopsis serialis]|uniref:uncharacterized protein n=1 Tax=Fomitopsis serialis TaxID=139415 RepID=UPI002007459C